MLHVFCKAAAVFGTLSPALMPTATPPRLDFTDPGLGCLVHGLLPSGRPSSVCSDMQGGPGIPGLCSSDVLTWCRQMAGS